MNDLLPRSSGEVVATLRSRLGTPMRWTVGPIVRTVNKTAVKLVSYNLRSQNGLHHCRAVEANVGRHRQRRSNRPNQSLGALIIGSVFSFSVVKWTDATTGPASGNRSTYQSAQRELTLTLRLLVVIAHDLVLDTFQILEEQSVVARRGIFWILPWWTHDRGTYFFSSECSLSTSVRDSALNAR